MSIQIIDNTPAVKAAKDAALQKSLEMMGQLAEGYAKGLSPVDTGRLRGSITHAQQGADTEIIGTGVEYAPYVEFGTQRMRAQPYLKPAVAGHTGEYKEIIESCLRGA